MRLARLGALVSLSAAIGLGACGDPGGGPATVAEIEVVRPQVTLGGRPQFRAERVSAGGVIATGEGGRAWVRHDASARALLDGGAKITVREAGLSVEGGRLWIEAAPGAHFGVSTEKVSLDASGARFEAVREGEGLRVYVASGEVAYRLGAGPAASTGTVRAGENGELGGAAKVTPAQLWDDWTGGLAFPEAGRGGDRARGHGEVGARRPGSLGEARFPLAITRLEVRTTITDDLATTRVVETFFNPASDTLEGLYRLRVPEGAILSRFAIDRNGRWADGYVKERETARQQYQAQVYEGSTKDPALLEWDAPGSYRARLYPLPAGATRKILVEYTEWLTPESGARTFRYPLAAGPDAPLLQELDIEVNADDSGAKSLRAGLDARIAGLKANLERTDYRPRADFVVDLVGDRKPDEARAYRSPHKLLSRALAQLAKEDDYYLVRMVPLAGQPAAERPPLDLVILTDISAATDATHLQLARTTVESILRHLDDKDRVAVAGADLTLHSPGPGQAPPKLVPASRVAIDPILDALARQGTGGATDLGATLAQAAALLDPARRGAVVYIGDALPTVGELDLKGLRDRLDRLSAPLRLYGVAIGDDADLALLSGLARDGGLAMRVGDRTAAAGAALRVIGHASRRVLHRVRADVGAGLDRTYPRRPVTVVEGEPFEVLARVRTGVPAEVSLNGLLDGRPWRAAFRPTNARADGDDLRLRWAGERLQQLLADGATQEEVAELGTRQNLITPFTSYYVPSADELSQLLRPTPAELAAGLALSSFGCGSRSAPAGAAPEPAPVVAAAPTSTPTVPTGSAKMKPAALRQLDEENNAPGSPAEAPSDDKPMAEEAKMDAPKKKAARPEPDTDNLMQPAEPGLGLIGTGAGGGGAGEGTIGIGGIGTIGRGNRAYGAAPPPPVAAAAPMATRASTADRRFAVERSKGKRARDDAATNGLLGALGGDQGGALAEIFKDSNKDADLRVARLGAVDGFVDIEGEDEGDIRIRIDITAHRPKRCSPASQLALADRADLWRERLSQHRGVNGALEIWQDAEQRCELKMWADRRALLRAMLQSVGGAARMVELYGRLSDDDAAQEFLRKAILAAARTPADLRLISDGLGLSQEVQWTLVEELVAKAKTPDERVTVLSQLLKRWQNDLRLKLKLMDALEALGRKEEARRVAEEVRAAPNADAQARTAVGELLVRLGDEPAARRAFSEIVEFAPQDPVARRRLGDLYRAHGWFDEALRQYETLAQLTPGDAAVLLLQAAAAAGAGRLDEALRLEQRVAGATEPGSETGIARTAIWWSTLRLALLRDDARKKGDEAELARLFGRTRRANVLHDARPLQIFLTWAHPEADCELWTQLPGAPMQPATEVAPELGIATLASREPLNGPSLIEVRRPPGAASAGLRYTADLVVIFDEGAKNEALVRLPIELAPGREVVRFRVDGRKVEVLQ